MPQTERSRDVTPAQGEYLKRLLKLEEDNEGQPVTTRRLASELNVRDASVTGMLDKLAQAHLVVYHPYYGARLTEQGTRIARDLERTYELLTSFLQGSLGYSREAAVVEAEHLEHHVSREFFDRLEQYLKR